MSKQWIAQLMQAGPVVTDGAWGTQMQDQGLGLGECADLWNVSRPELVANVARTYVEAGSRVILTNTFRANRIALAGYDAADRVSQINRAGAQISKKAAGDSAYVFASIGPSGKMILTGETNEEQLYEVFLEQAQALAQGGADAIVIETMADLLETRAAIRAVKQTGLPVVASMVYDSGKDKDRTMMGTTPEQAAASLTEAGADIIGANCGIGIEAFLPICERLAASTDRPIWIKANAGLPVLNDGQVTYPIGPDEFAAHAKVLVEKGAAFIGGCCGTGPDFIRALVRELGK